MVLGAVLRAIRRVTAFPGLLGNRITRTVPGLQKVTAPISRLGRRLPGNALLAPIGLGSTLVGLLVIWVALEVVL